MPVSILATPHLDAPLVINASLVSPDDGHIMATLPNVPLYTFATHAGPHKYRVGDTIVDTWTGEQQANVRDPSGHDLIVATTKHLTRYDATGAARWQLPALHETFVAGTDFADLDNGDAVIANWGAIVWEVHVPGLGVGHSEYMHGAYIEVRGDEVYVVSQAVGGAFFERLSLTTGKSELRHVM